MEKRRVTKFILAIILTIVFVRILTNLIDPNIILFGYELHHFYYGIVLLMIVYLITIFRKDHSDFILVLGAISIGLILDEFVFILGKLSNHQYPLTISLVFYTLVIFLIILDLINIRRSKKIKTKKN